ncbi:MAG: alpha/beta fold hydrolase [Christensenellales bacterium]
MIDVLGIPSHVEQYGTRGEEILLLHGWGVDLAGYLAPLAQALAGDYRVTALDFPAHGLSGRPGETWGVAEYAAWVKALMTALRLPPQTLIAHSFGARVAIHLAAREPALVRRLVLTGAAGLIREKTPAEEAEARRYQQQKLQLERLAALPLLGRAARAAQTALRDRRSSPDYKALDEDMKKTFVRIITQDLAPLLPEIKQSTLLIWGEQDTQTPLWMGQRMAEAIPDAALIPFAGRGHFAYLEELPRFVSIVQAFIREDKTLRD